MSLAIPNSTPSLRARLGHRALRRVADRWSGTPVIVELPEGDRISLGAPAGAGVVRLRLNTYRALRRALVAGDLGFAEGYMAGDWDTTDLPALLIAFAGNFEGLSQLALGHPLHQLTQLPLKWLQANTVGGARRNIRAHYDLGNDFYAAWLDGGMSYSSALYQADDEPMERAHARKYAALARAVDLRPDHSLLEIGCGWGAFAEFAARDIGAQVTAVTISPAQHAYASARIQRAGLAERVRIELCDYRHTTGRFDRVVSIEMFEAVGERYWPTFFEVLRARLAPGGRAGFQVITIADDLFDDYRRRVDFIQKYVFPGGMLPSDRKFRQVAGQAGLTCSSVTCFGADYARTLRAWRGEFERAWPRLGTRGLDERFYRLWRFYLAYCEAGFATGRTDVAQFVLEPGRR